MKTLFTLIVCCTTMLSVYAQGSNNTVTINYNGQNRQVLIDGRSYTPVENTNFEAGATSGARSYRYSIVANELASGAHKLEMIRQNNRRNSESTFNLRSNYDLVINVDGDGSLQQTETFRRPGTTGSTGTSSMSTARFNALYSEISRNRQATSRYNMIQAAFSNMANYFTTVQARRLIQLINGEPFRLQLAKVSVARITDTRNLNSLSTVLASQAGKNELLEYIRVNGAAVVPGGTGSSTMAMTANTYNTLFEDVRNRYQAGARLSTIQTAFAQGSNNYFSTAQVAQLVQLLSSEGERLQVLKTAYNRVVDKNNFTQTYTLLSTLQSREELAYHIRSNGNSGSSDNTGSNNSAPMTDANFSSLFEGIRSAWGTGVRKREVMNAFANTNNRFSVYQVAQLVQLETEERDRLDLAKASLRSIVDPQNIALLYNALTMQSTRDELAAYINVYNGGTGVSPGTSTSITPMSDANFATLLEETSRMWLPGAKKATVLQNFATPNRYFTTAQVIQLIQLDRDEPDRLEMAKASYKTVVDKQNFARVYDLFTMQIYKTELAGYIEANP